MTSAADSATGRGSVEADDTCLTLVGEVDGEATYDVSLNGQHVWSLVPGRDTEHDGERFVATWPPALTKFLSGQATIAVHHHVTREEIGSAHHVFGGVEDRQVSVTGPHGETLILDKWGRLTRPLSGAGSDLVELLLDEIEALLRFLDEEVGVPAFICYGTLLGAVRDGKLIGHDNDVDVAYLSAEKHPVDVVREGYRVERRLRDAGWDVRRGSGTRLNVRVRLSDGSVRFVDVFTAHWVLGVLYIPSDTGFRLPRETILPLTTAPLHGRPMPAPADSERLLAATYGERWRVPDPAFRYTTPRWLTRRIGGWFGGLMARRKHWDSFYSQQWARVPKEPSDFARWVQAEYPADHRIVDVGSGTGRDVLWFAESAGREALGIDFSIKGVRRSRRRAREGQIPARFEVLNLHDLRAVLALGARLALDEAPCDVYVRLTMNGLEPDGQDNVLRLASMATRRGGHLFLEFRTLADQRRPHEFPGHSRLFLDPAAVAAQIVASGGQVVAQHQGTGLARLRGEDAHVARIVARWAD